MAEQKGKILVIGGGISGVTTALEAAEVGEYEAQLAIEEARAYRMLMDELELSQAELADRVGKNRATIANSLRLLVLAKKVQEKVRDGVISAGHARALAALGSPKDHSQLPRTDSRELLITTSCFSTVSPGRNVRSGRCNRLTTRSSSSTRAQPRRSWWMTSVMPACFASSTQYWIIGLSTMGSISFGIALVAGRNLVPSPAMGNTAFLIFILFSR